MRDPWQNDPDRTTRRETPKPRYRVDSLGRAGRAALVTDTRTNAVVMKIVGPDQWETADRVADALNASWTETPVAP